MARRVSCEDCEFERVVRKEDVSEYRESGMGGTTHQVASRLRRDHREASFLADEADHDVHIQHGTIESWTREFVPDE